MDLNAPTPLLGDLSPTAFMRRHWHRKPLLIRQAVPGMQPLLSRAELFDLAARPGVESRLIVRSGDDWTLRHGPFKRQGCSSRIERKVCAADRDELRGANRRHGRSHGEDEQRSRSPESADAHVAPIREEHPPALPRLGQPDWTLLVQGVDLHSDAARALLERFRFIGDARLDDLMISYASEGGGVGPHFDSYDVFLLQAHGRRRWRIGRQTDLSLQEGKPLKVLRHFEPEQEWLLEPGDMLYLPPQWAHDGVAESADCMTYSIGFRAPTDVELAQELMLRLGEFLADEERARRYADKAAQPMASPAALPPAMLDFAAQALRRVMDDPALLARALGEVLTDPKPSVGFDDGDAQPEPWAPGLGLALDRRTRMLHDARHVFVNGEAFVVGGRDGRLLRQLADARVLDAREAAALSEGAREVMAEWLDMGWLHAR